MFIGSELLAVLICTSDDNLSLLTIASSSMHAWPIPHSSICASLHLPISGNAALIALSSLRKLESIFTLFPSLEVDSSQ